MQIDKLKLDKETLRVLRDEETPWVLGAEPASGTSSARTHSACATQCYA